MLSIKGTIVTGVGSATLALLFNLDSLSQMISVGTLLAFVLVSGGILVLRWALTRDFLISVADINNQQTTKSRE